MTADTVGALRVKVVARREEAKDVASFELMAVAGHTLPESQPDG